MGPAVYSDGTGNTFEHIVASDPFVTDFRINWGMGTIGRNSTYAAAAHEESAAHEPLCAVKAAVDSGIISPERYNSYLGMLEEDKKFR